MDVEACLITSVLDNEGLEEALSAGITSGFFDNEDSQAVWQWMRDFFVEHQVTPTIAAVSNQFPKYVFEPERKEPLAFLIQEMFSLRRRRMLQDTISGTREFYDEGDTDRAIKWLTTGLQEIQIETIPVQDIDFTEDAAAWLDEYKDKVKKGQWFVGMPSGFEFIDRILGGVQNGQLITLVGLPKSGKSTAILFADIAAHASGYYTFFTTFEMSAEEQRLRHHAFRAHISYSRLKFGKLHREETIRLRKMLRGLENMQPMMFAHDPSSLMTVSALAAKLTEHRPDIAFVDGTYLMECDNPAFLPNSPQALTSITRDLKRLAQRLDIPIINTTQVLPSKYSAKQGIRMESIGYTSSFAQDSDAIFGIETDPDYPEYMLISVVAARNAPPARARYSIDWEVGKIEEIEMVSGDDEDDPKYPDE